MHFFLIVNSIQEIETNSDFKKFDTRISRGSMLSPLLFSLLNIRDINPHAMSKDSGLQKVQEKKGT
jgi:hypothetical protein